jgi:hypothetical protein
MHDNAYAVCMLYRPHLKHNLPSRVRNIPIIGLATGVPVMCDFPLLQDVRDEYLRRHIDPNDYYHYGEMIIDKEYRSKKLGSELLQ